MRSAAAQLADDDREGIAEALASVYLDRDTFGLEDVDFEALEVGEPLPAYEALPSGPERVALDYFPLFQDGELVAFALRTEGGMFQLDTALARGVGSLGPDQAALVFDRGACWVWDGASLGTAFETAEPGFRIPREHGVDVGLSDGAGGPPPARPGFGLGRDLGPSELSGFLNGRAAAGTGGKRNECGCAEQHSQTCL